MKSKFLIAIIGIQVLLYACSQVFITEMKKPSASFFSKKEKFIAHLETESDVTLIEFKKAYARKYKSDEEFVEDYKNKFSAKLVSPTSSLKTSLDSSSAYKLILSNFRISNRIVRGAAGGGPNMPMATTSTEFCIVTARYKIIETATKEVIADFESKGESSVVLFAFEAALMKAIDKSMDHAISYLNSGKTQF
jgi:hypothetical protein